MKKLALSEPKPHKTFRDKYLAVVMMVAALLISAIATAQDSAKYSPIGGYGFRYKRHAVDSVMLIPLSTSPHTPYRMGALRYKAADSTLQLWTGHQWNSIVTGVGNGVDTAYTYNDSTIAIETPDQLFFVTIPGRHWDLQGVLNNGSTLAENENIILADSIELTSGWVVIESLRLRNITSSIDTSTYKPVAVGPNGNTVKLLGWPGSGGGSVTPGYGINVSGSIVKVDTTKLDTRYLKVFNVTDSSLTDPADPDSSAHDDCPAIKQAMQRAYDAGGGIVYFPLGHYTLGCALNHSTNGVDPDAQIVLPLTRDTATHKPRIIFEGAAWNNWSAELATVTAKNRSGVILESTILDTGWVFGSSYYNDAGFGGHVNWTWWSFNNIEIRVRTKTSGTEIANTMNGIDAWAPRSIGGDNVKITVQSSEGSMLEPYAGSIGIRLPHWNNNGNIIFGNLNISGYYTGLYAAEHMKIQQLTIFSCHDGIYLPWQLHSGDVDRYTSEGCVNHIYVSDETGSFVGGPMNMHIGSYNAEHYTVGGQWNTFSRDVAWADTSVNCHILIDYASINQSFTGRVGNSFANDAPAKVTVGFDAELGSNYLYRTTSDNWEMSRGVSSSGTDGNMIIMKNSAASMGFSFGDEIGLGAGSSAFIGGRGLTYSAGSNQRGNIFIGAGQPSSPTTNEGSILFLTGAGIPRFRIRNDGSMVGQFLTRSSTNADSTLLPNPSTGVWEVRPIVTGGTLQSVLNGGRLGDTVVISSSSGTNRDVALYNENSGADNLGVLKVRTYTGTNTGAILNLADGGSGFSGISSQLGLYNLGADDPTNYELLQLRATNTNYIINSTKGGTGSLRPLKLQMGGFDCINISTGGIVSFNSSSNNYIFPATRASAGQVLTDAAGDGNLSWAAPSGNYSLIYTDTSTTTVTNTGAATTLLGNMIGSASFSGSTVTAGTKIVQKGFGIISTKASSPGDLEFDFTISNYTLGISLASMTAALSNVTYEYEFTVTTFATGTNQDIFYNARIKIMNSGAVVAERLFNGKSTMTTTGTLACDVKADWSVADTDNTVTSRGNTLEVFRMQ